MTASVPEPRFWNYPPPKQGPDVPARYEGSSNPVLRGVPLTIAATIISSSTFIQGLLWKANKFDKLKDIKELQFYEPRHDPTVVPFTGKGQAKPFSISDVQSPARRRNESSYYTCSDYHALYKAGKLTPTDVVESLLPLISRESSPAGKHSVAFLESKAEIIRTAAAASTERYAAGKPLSVLDGVPLAVKDEADLAGYSRTLGSKLDFANPANQTSWCVAKWEEAGGIVIGKTNMHEMGLDTTNNNPNTGTPLNPHNSNYYTGGSSGGSAYAVASGLCPIALGADGGGSIRLPSSFCGIYGLKPSHGRVSGRPTRDLGNSVGVYGPMASSIDDLAVGYEIMARADPESRGSSLFPNPTIVSDLGVGKKYLGICKEWIDRADPEVRKMFDAAIDHYVQSQGYEMVNISMPFLPEGQKAHALTILSEVRSGVSPQQISKLIYPNQLLLTVAGGHATGQDFLYSQRLRDLQMKHLSHLWEKYPGMIIFTPTTPCAGWKIGNPKDVVRGGYGVSDGDMSLKSMEYVYLANWTGCPAISCPMGYTADDVPVGMMGMGIWGSEQQLLAFGRDGDAVLGERGCRRPQQNFVDALSVSEPK